MKLITRKEQKKQDCWDLSSLFANDKEWEETLEEIKKEIPVLLEYKGKLSQSVKVFSDFLVKYFSLLQKAEALGVYAYLRLSEDGGEAERQKLWGIYLGFSAQFSSALSFVEPEILKLPQEITDYVLKDDSQKDYHIWLKKLLRYKKYILTEEQEKLLAELSESRSLAQRAFSALNDVDMEFGTVETEKGLESLTHGSYMRFMENRNRAIREQAYMQYLNQYKKHYNTISTLYTTQVKQNSTEARLRGYKSSLEAKLYPDDVSTELYTHLIKQVEEALPVLHRYYELRRNKLNLDKLKLYDTKVPLTSEPKINYPYEEAVEIVCKALSPLGEDYTNVLKKGLTSGWVDRYENKGKRSGAFSYGCYSGEPYILLNYDPTVLRHVFTLAHEAGHSMHSYYSVKNNPFPHYNYSIFEAEVASTFNEELLLDYMLKQADKTLKTALILKHTDELIGTYFRQTMFAEFELAVHNIADAGQPVTGQNILEIYQKLLKKYFGPAVEIGEIDCYESLRIPHFYRAFYVYKYATGITAALNLAEAVKQDKAGAKEAYRQFLSNGGSSFPIENLKKAGVDLMSDAPYKRLSEVFASHVAELEKSLL
ncbi:oligoendopeptidase F [Spirochaetia bacterium 38H-sp]|uniref:Oligopeptidase F n=1 Tax=Rarispira pelagica TaxID=3141764 RepID=A0ABU9UDQ8_9SPIR